MRHHESGKPAEQRAANLDDLARAQVTSFELAHILIDARKIEQAPHALKRACIADDAQRTWILQPQRQRGCTCATRVFLPDSPRALVLA